jgi:hypothetical protein
MNRRWRVALATVVAVYAVGLGVLGGVALDRIRDDQQRQAQVKREAEATRRAREQAMEMERRALTERPGAMPWVRRLP